MRSTSITQATLVSPALPRQGSDDAAAQDGEFDAVLADVGHVDPTATHDDATPTTSLGLPLMTTAGAATSRSSASPPTTGGPDVHALLAKLSIGSDTASTAAPSTRAAAASAPPAQASAAGGKVQDGTQNDPPETVTATEAAATIDAGTVATLVAMPIALAGSAMPKDVNTAPAATRPATVIGRSASSGSGAAATDHIGSPSAEIISGASARAPSAPSIEPGSLAGTSSSATPLAAAGATLAKQIDGSSTSDVKVAVLGTARHLAPVTQAARIATTAGNTSPQEPSAARNLGVGAPEAAMPSATPTVATAAIGAAITGAAPSAEIETTGIDAQGSRPLPGLPGTGVAEATTAGATAAGAGAGAAGMIPQAPKPLPAPSGARDTAMRAPTRLGLVGAGATAGEAATEIDADASTSSGTAVAAGASRSPISGAADAADAAGATPTSKDPVKDAAPDAALPAGTLRTIANAVTTLADETASTTTAQPSQAAPQSTTAAPARSLTLRLGHGTLGAVTVHLHMTGGGLDLRLDVADDTTLGAISRARDELASAIGDAGTRLQSLTIQSADPSPALAGSNDSARNDTQSGGGAGDPDRRGSGEGAARGHGGGTPSREPAASGDRGGDGVFV